MTQKLLISTDRNGIAEFQKAVQGTCDAANSLISIFNEFQPWQKIVTLDQFTELVSDPKKYFDDTIVVNVHVTARGLTVDPEQAARLFNISRDLYNNAVSGMPLVMDDCPECQRAKVIPGRKAISKYQFDQYRDYLLFSAGIFTVNTEAVDADLDRFNVYATTPAEVALYEHFTGLVEILNKHDAMYTLPNPEKKTIANTLHLHLTEAYQGAFMLDVQYLSNEIGKLKYQK